MPGTRTGVVVVVLGCPRHVKGGVFVAVAVAQDLNLLKVYTVIVATQSKLDVTSRAHRSIHKINPTHTDLRVGTI